jgi:hypothetical protein
VFFDEEVALAIKQDAVQVSWKTGTGHPFRSGQGEEASIFIGDFQGVYRGATLGIAPDGEIADMPLDRDSWLALFQWRQSETLTNSRGKPNTPVTGGNKAYGMTNERVIGLSLSHLKSPEALNEALLDTQEPKSERELTIVFHQNGLNTVSARLIAPGSRLVGFGPSSQPANDPNSQPYIESPLQLPVNSPVK